MPNRRLETLRRQKTLIEEHLAWLDREIAAEVAPAEPGLSPRTGNRLNPPNPSPSAPQSPAASDEPDQASAIPDIYDELGPDTKSSVRSARLGCLLAFGLGFAAVGVVVWMVYYLY